MLHDDIDKAYETALNLERTVIDDAKKQADRIITQAQLAEKEAVSVATVKARDAAQKYEQHERALIAAKYRNIQTCAHARSKAELIKKRADIQTAVFDRLRKRLTEFTSSDAYREYSMNVLSALPVKTLPDSTVVLVSQNPVDMACAKELLGNLKVQTCADISLGGFIIRDDENGILYDLTLDSRFEQKKSEFPSLSGLVISD